MPKTWVTPLAARVSTKASLLLMRVMAPSPFGRWPAPSIGAEPAAANVARTAENVQYLARLYSHHRIGNDNEQREDFHMKLLLTGVALATLALGAAEAWAQSKTVTIAHQDMVVPYRYAMVNRELEQTTGWTVNWRMFGGGGDVIRAMASGDVKIGEAGSSPIAAGISQGLNLELFYI